MPISLPSYVLHGLSVYPVHIEVEVSRGMPHFSIIGMAGTAVQEARDRVRSALTQSAYQFPLTRKIVNLAPAELAKQGSHFDLGIAMGLLMASGQVPPHSSKTFLIGELSLEGELRAVRGVLSATAFAASQGFSEIILPEENAAEASLVPGIKIYPARNLREVVAHFQKERLTEYRESKDLDANISHIDTSASSFEDIAGQTAAKRALIIAAAGGHHLLFQGPPGTGKSLLAKSLAEILPPLSKDEAIEVLQVHSLLRSGAILQTAKRPFRAPHQRCTTYALMGGGPQLIPGEVSLAHRGVLFLDEWAEFPKASLEQLRIPLEESCIFLKHGPYASQFPCAFQLVAAMNPCPCGFLGDPKKDCRCSGAELARYRSKLSGPLMDRLDLHVWVPRQTYDDLHHGPKETGLSAQEQVQRAREIQMKRFGGTLRLNRDLNPRELKGMALPDEAIALLREASERYQLSARAIHRLLKVSQTIADLSCSDLRIEHLSEALQYRHPG